MGSVMIGDFGVKDGVRTFRICGAKADIEKIIEEAVAMGHKFANDPVIEKAVRLQWTTLLQIKVLAVEVTKNENYT